MQWLSFGSDTIQKAVSRHIANQGIEYVVGRGGRCSGAEHRFAEISKSALEQACERRWANRSVFEVGAGIAQALGQDRERRPGEWDLKEGCYDFQLFVAGSRNRRVRVGLGEGADWGQKYIPDRIANALNVDALPKAIGCKFDGATDRADLYFEATGGVCATLGNQSLRIAYDNRRLDDRSVSPHKTG